MALSQPTNYSDFLNKLQSYSASRRAATGRGLTSEELQGMTSGYLDAENARKMDQWKTSATLGAQQNIANQRNDLLEKQFQSQQQQALGQGLLSGVGGLGKMYLTDKYLTKAGAEESPGILSRIQGILSPNGSTPSNATPLGNAIPSMSAINTGETPNILNVLGSTPELETTTPLLSGTLDTTSTVTPGILSNMLSWMGPVGAGLTGGNLGGMGARSLDVVGKNEADIGGGIAGGAAAGAAAGAPFAGVGAVPGAVVGGIVGGLEGLFESGFFDDLF